MIAAVTALSGSQMFDRVRTRERIPLIENRRAIAVGALVQLGATVAYLQLTSEVGSGLLWAGFVGGLVVGAITAEPVTSIADGAAASVGGGALFAGFMLVVGAFESVGVGGVGGTNLFLMLYTNYAIILLVLAVPAHAVFGSIGGFVAGTASKWGSERVRSRSDVDRSH